MKWGRNMLDIVFQNDDCIVVNKKAGESTEPLDTEHEAPESAVQNSGRRNMVDLPHALAEQVPGSMLPEAVHRLDVPVSGCVLFARNERSLVRLISAFSRLKGIEQIYWAVMEIPEAADTFPEYGELEHWLLADAKLNKTIAYTEPGPYRKKAALSYRIAGRGEHYLFFEIKLITGRHHQIRAQLARLGLHIKGDLKYGARRSEKAGGIRLHAYSLAFPDASTGAQIRVCALPPVRDALWLACESAVLKCTAGN
jgi:23S rRNA pseudouridine1911/1915/1917 synthase